MRRTPATLVNVVTTVTLAALALAGCGGSNSADHVSSVRTVTRTVTTPPPSSTAAPTTTTTAAATTTTTTTAAAGAGGPGACTAPDLAGRFIAQNGATGNVVLEFALRNVGAAACHTYGYPGVEFRSKSGAPLPTTPTHTTEDLLGSTQLQAITLAPGQQASFRLVAATDAQGGGSCPTAAALQVIAPDDTAPLTIAIPGGAYECGRTTVSPLQTGASAAPGV